MGLRNTTSPERRALIGRLANVARHQPDADMTDLRRQLGFFTASDAIKHIMAKFPPFNDEQERDLIGLIRSARARSASAPHGEAA